MLIIGDSHVRSFSYSPHAFPVFLSSGKTLLLNTQSECFNTLERIESYLSKHQKFKKAYAVIGEPSLRFFLKNRESNEKPLTATICDNYSKNLIGAMLLLAERVEHNLGVQLLFLPPIPRKDSNYALLWKSVVQEQKRKNFKLAAIFDSAVDDNGQITDAFFGDYIHANEKLADLLFRVEENYFVPSSNRYKWNYRYDFESGETVWGEVGAEFLHYTGTISRDLKKVCHKTQSLKRIVRAVKITDIFFNRYGKVKTIICTNDEGAWGFYSSGKCILDSSNILCLARFAWLTHDTSGSLLTSQFTRKVFDLEMARSQSLSSLNFDVDEIIIVDDRPIDIKIEHTKSISYKIGSLYVSTYTQTKYRMIYKFFIFIFGRFV